MRLFRRRVTDPELDAELRFHLDQLTATNIRAGMPSDEARREAVLEFGAVEPAKEACRDLRPLAMLHTFLRDLGYAARRARQAPGFTAVAVLSLALGIGANTALFSLVNAALLRLIPVERPEELVWFNTHSAHTRLLNYPFYQSLEGDSRFSGLLCAFPVSVTVSSHYTATARVEAELVSGTYFSTLGVRPHLGRLIVPADDRVRLGHYVAVVSYAWWQSHLGADPMAVGRTIRVNGAPYTVIGVAQPGFNGVEHGYVRSLFFPVHMKAQITPGWDGLEKPLIAWLWIMGRLKPGVDRDALGNELDARLHALQEPHLVADKRLTPSQTEMLRHRRVYLSPLRDTVLGRNARTHLRTLAWMVAALLMLACTNIAGVLLARGLERRREIATRLSIGASRGRVMAQLLTESLLIGGLGGLAGLLLGAVTAPVLASRFPLAGQGSHFDVPLDATVLAFTLAVSIAACLAFGLVPAWHSTRLDLIGSLKSASPGPRRRRLRHLLLAGQVAAALVLLIVAGLFATNLRRLEGHDAGFASRRMLITEIEPMLNGYGDDRRLNIYRQLDERLLAAAQTPGSGIAHAALSNVAPLSPYYWSSLFLVDGRSTEKDFIPRAVAVGPGYFDAMRIPLRRGRLLTERDDRGAPRVALISESLARRAFPDADPIGRRFMGDAREPEKSIFEIVGIVADVDLQDPRRRDHRECVYVPYRQWPFTPQAIVIQARLTSDEALPAALATVRRTVRDVDPSLALYDVRTIETALDTLLATERLAAWLTSFFALLAALLAAIGLYGMLAREVAARTREIGLRLALGATRPKLIWELLRSALLAVSAGALAGITALYLTRPLLEPLLVDVTPTDPTILASALAFLVVVTTISALRPARQATHTDPAEALRCE